MKCTVDYAAFKQLVKDTAQVFCVSEQGGEAIKGDDATPMFLRTDDKHMYAEASVKGVEVRGFIPLITSEEPGRVAIKMNALTRLSGSSKTLNLSKAGDSLVLEAGAFKAQVATLASAKMAVYDEVPLTHTVDGRLLRAGIKAVMLADLVDGHPNVRIRFDEAGLRCWANNAFYASHVVAFDAAAFDVLEFTAHAGFLDAAAAAAPKTSPMIQLGCDGKSYRVKTDVLDVTCPLKDFQIEDMDLLAKQLQVEAFPSYTVAAGTLVEALDAVGSVDIQAATSKQACLDMTCFAPKKMVILTVKTELGYTKQTFPVPAMNNIETDHLTLVNARALAVFTNRLKGRDLQIYMLPDRLVLRSGPYLYLVTVVVAD
jgi:hypothetical protein